MNKYEKLLNMTMSEVNGVPKSIHLEENHPSLAHSTLKLFNALPVKALKTKNPTKDITELTVNNGFVFSPTVCANYTKKELVEMIEMISNEIGLSPEQMNASFHKSWKKVRDAPMEQLVFEQVVHYMTTYGYEAMGIYSQDTVYIPSEKLEIPKIDSDIKLVVINGYTNEQLKEKLMIMLSSGMALKSTNEVVTVAIHCEINADDLELIRNREVRIMLCDNMGIMPKNPNEFLRFLIFKTTEKPLVIVNEKTLAVIKKSTVDTRKMFAKYDAETGYKKLAEIFKRYKPLFLAMKEHKGMAPIINKISHLSGKYHKPLAQPIMNNITGILKSNDYLTGAQLKELDKELATSNIFRKTRLLHALKYRMIHAPNIVYKIRNGKSHVDTMEFDNIDGAKKIAMVVLKSLASDLNHLQGKKIYIPKNVQYAIPSSEKQFTGNIPSGTSVTVNKDMIFGVHWENIDPKHSNSYDDGRVDIDLSLVSIAHGKVGWDSRYRTDNSTVLFSGDITDAPKPKGATELFYVADSQDDVMLLYANYFNMHDNNAVVPIKIMVAEEHPARFTRNYTIDPRHIQCIAKTEISEKQKVIGLLIIKDGECKFYFAETGMGNARTSYDDDKTSIARNYFATYVANMLTLNDMLKFVGAEIVNTKDKDAIDLSPETLQKDTFINLLINKN